MQPEQAVEQRPDDLAQWVPEAVRVIVEACDPRTIVLFGSVARVDANSGSDIDLLVVIDDAADWAEAGTAALRAVACLTPEVDVIVTTQARVDATPRTDRELRHHR